MQRARAALLAAILVVLSVGGVVAASGGALAGAVTAPAAVTWPVATLLISEVQTGGASASDEFVELTNASSIPVDLAGLEVAYVTSTGGTVTRKASWTTTRILDPGRHLVIANASGVFASLADATYSGGFAATGGSVVLRVVGGAPIDAVGWGDATNAFVEGTAATAPPALASIERLPGGLAGNSFDTNANAADFFLQPAPNPQNTSAPPVPAPAPSATAGPSAPPSAAPTASPVVTATPTPDPTPDPTESVTPSEPPISPTPEVTIAPTPSVDPTSSPAGSATPLPSATPQPSEPAPTPSASPTPEPSPSPSSTPEPSPTPSPSPTPEPSATATPRPSPTPIAAAIPILDARALPDGASATVEGVLTTALGALEAGRVGFVQDASGGIAIYLGEVPVESWPAGTLVRVTGVLDQRYEERTLRVPLAGVTALGGAPLPAPVDVSTGAVGEYLEGTRVAVSGAAVGSPTSFADGLGILVDDGSGQVRVIVGADALAGREIPAGTTVHAVGPVGQRDSSGTGLAGYRLHATSSGELAITPPPPPSPSPSPTAMPVPTATPAPAQSTSPSGPPIASPPPSASPTPAPSPSPAPSTTPAPAIDLVAARSLPAGARVSVVGIVTAEGGRLGSPPLLAIADATAGIVVRLPDGVRSPLRGTVLAVTGPLADPYGQLEIRPDTSGFTALGFGQVPEPLPVGARELGEGTEGMLVEIVGTARSAARRATSGDITVDLADGSGVAFRLAADASSGVTPSDIAVGVRLRVVGIVGQHASRKGALDGYRIWVRDRADVTVATSAIGSGSTSSPTSSEAPALVSAIATLRGQADGSSTTIEAIVTAGGGLLDGDGRRIVVQDATGAIEVLLPATLASPQLGAHLRVAGTLGHAWGAPRIAATKVDALAPVGLGIAARQLTRAPGSDDEWILARVSGEVVRVERMGTRWRAEIQVGNERVLVSAVAASGVPSTAIVEGRTATIVGIVRRPYPSATDRRFALVPRGAWDVAVGPAAGRAGASPTSAAAGGSTATAGRSSVDPTPDTDLAVLADLIGRSVRVGGLVVDVVGDEVRLDDGTGVGTVLLRGEAASFAPLLRPGEALSARGIVTIRGGSPVVEVTDPAAMARVGVLGQAMSLADLGSTASASPEAVPVRSADLVVEPAPGGVALVLAGALSALIAVARRRLVHRRLLAVATARLATLRDAPG